MKISSKQEQQRQFCNYSEMLAQWKFRYIAKFRYVAKLVYGSVTPQTFFLNDFFSWNLSFRCFKVHHEFIIMTEIFIGIRYENNNDN